MEPHPVIGLTGRWNKERQTYIVADDYRRAVEAAGGIPALIPLVPEGIERLLGEMDGFVLCGNPSDIDPARYSRQRDPHITELQPERDETDWRILDHAFAERKPVLGICFGMQSLNVHRGGTLVQDIPTQVPGALQHDDREARHSITLDPASKLAAWLGEAREIRVNSTHHQAADILGKAMRIAARASDNVIEAVEGEDPDHFVIGVQWHPERIWESEALSARLFLELVRAAVARQLAPANTTSPGTQTPVVTPR
jgi:putative glutamine amidotransferase